MKEDPELRMNDGSPQDRTYSKGRGIRTHGNKHLPALLGIMLILIFAVGIFYFIPNRPTARDTKGEEILASKIAALEQKVTGLEGQITELQGKSNKGATDPFLLHQVEVLTQKVEALEKRGQQPGVESKTRPAPQKPAVTSQKNTIRFREERPCSRLGRNTGSQ